MIKYLLIAVAVFVLYKLITNERGRKNNDESKDRDRKIAAGEMVKDPICGTYVETDSSIKVRDGNAVHHFCSYDCRQKFLDKLEEAGRDIPELPKKDD
ncbi:transcriptional regulator [Desulfovibrio sp. OttesenSCG-928-G15]|nr:transcriptional regulator [Desulfovibrio sp. OttesenSCG-928-G15]